METSVFIARIFGLSYLIMGIGLSLNRKFYQKMMEDFSKNTALVLFAGLFALVIGVAILLNHNVWVANWTVMVTLIGWGALIKGTWLITLPSSVLKFMQVYQRNQNMIAVHGVIVIILGIIFTFFGFFSG